MKSFTFDLQRFDTVTIAAGESVTFDDVTYTAISDAVLNLDDSGKVSGIASGKVSAVVTGASDSPTLTLDATEKALAFTLTAEDGALVATNNNDSERTITLTEGTLSIEGYDIVAGAGSTFTLSLTSSGMSYTFVSEKVATYSVNDDGFSVESEHSTATVSIGGQTLFSLELYGKMSEIVKDGIFHLSNGTTVSYTFSDGSVWSVTSNSDDSGSISFANGGLQIVPAAEGSLSINVSNDENNYVNFTSITGTVTFSDSGLTLSNGSTFSGEWSINGIKKTISFVAEGGTATITFANDGSITSAASDDATLTINLDDRQMIVHSGSVTDNIADSTLSLPAGSAIEVDGVTYTALDGAAVLKHDDNRKISGIASGKVSAVVAGASDSPTLTIDATDSAVTFTATSDGSVISTTPFPIEYISGEFTYNGSTLAISAGSDLAIVTQRGDFLLRNQNHFDYDSTYTFTSTALTSDAQLVISDFSLTNGSDVRQLQLEQLGKVINYFAQQGVTLVEGSSEVLNIGDYKLTATATNGDAGLNFELGEDGMTFVPNTGDGTLTVALSRNDKEIISGILECTSGTVTIGYDHAVTFTEGTSFNFTWNNYVSTITATGDATTAIALTDNGITFTPGSGDGGLYLLLTKDGKTVFGGILNISDGSITFNSDEKKFSFTEGTKISLGIGTDGSRAMDFEIVGGDASFKMAADENGNFTITPDTNDGSLSIALKQNGETVFQNNVTVNGSMTINPVTDLLTLTDGTTVSLAFKSYTMTATASGNAASKISLTEEGISITPQQGDGTLNLTLGSTVGSMNVGIEVLSGGFLFGTDGALNVVEGTELKLKFSDDYIVNFKVTDAAGGALSIGSDGLSFTPAEGDGHLELTVSRGDETRTTSLEMTGSLTYKLDGSITLAKGTVLKNAFEDGNVLTITALTDASGSITFNPQTGLTITPATADALNIVLTTGDLNVVNISSITGSITYSGGVITASDGTKARISYYFGWESDLYTTGGTASIQFTDDRTIYTANEGSTFTVDYLDGTTTEIQNGSYADVYGENIEDYTELVSEGTTLRSNDAEVVFTLEKAGNYNLNGMSVTTTEDNVEVMLANYDTITFGQGAQIDIATSISGNDLDVVASATQGQGIVTVDNDGNITYDATNGTLQVTVPLEDVIGDSLLPGDFTISGGSITMGATDDDGIKPISITAGTELSFTKNGMTFDTVIQNDISGRLWMRNGTVIYLHSYEEANFDTTITFADKEIFNGMITVVGAFAYNAATGTTGPVDSNTYNVHDSYIQVALGNQSLKLTTKGDTFFAVLDVDDDGKISFDFNNENYNSMLLAVSNGDTDVLNAALQVTGKIVIDPATQEVSLVKDTVLSLTQNGNTLEITALDDAGGKLTVIDSGIRFAPNENDGALELNFVAVNRKADLNITGAVIFGNDGKISLEDGTEVNLTWEDGNSLKLTSSGSTGSIGFSDKGLRITSDDENLDMTFTTPSMSTDISGIKGTIYYNAGIVSFDENSTITATTTLGGQPIFTTLETIDGTGHISFNTTNGVIYAADTGALRVTWSRDDLESTFTVNEGSVQLGHNLFQIAEGSDIATDLKTFVPAFYFTTSEAGTYTINGQTITTSAEGLALTATDDYMSFTTSDDVVTYDGMTFAGAGKVSLSPDNVVLGAGVEATGFGEGNSFVLAEAGNVTADAKIFELSKIEGTPREIPMIITVTGAQDGFVFSRTLTKESEAYLDDALSDEKFENYSSSYIGQVFTEKFISAGDSSYRTRTDPIGLEEVIGISDGATVTGGASLADEPTLSYYNLVTDTEGTFTIGEKAYNVSGDSSVAIRARFEVDTAPYASYVDSLNGTISGDFSGGAFKINGSSSLQVVGDSSIDIVADASDFEILGLDAGASLKVEAADTYTVNGTTINANAGDYIVGLGESSAFLMGTNNNTLITGTELDDYIANSGASVTINALGGNDHISNFAANVSINAGNGDNYVENVAASVTINGGEGNDTIYNVPGNLNSTGEFFVPGKNFVNAGAGDDWIKNNSISSTITAGAGNDSIYNVAATTEVDGKIYKPADDLINGGDGDDYIENDGANVTIDAGAGNDSITNTGDNVLFQYSGGNDSISGFNATSTLSISGSDYSTATSGNDLIVTVGESKITLINAASLSSANIETPDPIVQLVEAALKRTAAGYPAIAAVAFHPDEDLGDEPTNYSDKEDWTITSSDNLKLHAVHYTPENSNDKWVVIIHGYGHSHKYMYQYATAYLDNGYNVLMIDQRAAGESEGTWLTMGVAESEDVALWTQEIARRNSNAKITLHGISMGSATAMLAAARSDATNVTSLVEDCGYTNVLDVFSIINDAYLKQPSEVVTAMDPVAASLTGYYLHEAAPIDSISSVTMPSIFITGDADSVVPMSMFTELYDASGAEVKEQFIVKDATHGRAGLTDSIGYSNAVFRFVAEADGEGWVTTNTTDEITLRGTKYDDTITNSGYFVAIAGLSGNDSIVNEGEYTSINGGAGNDTISNSGASSIIEGDAGADVITNSSSTAMIRGGDGADTISNTGDNVTVDGGAGNDSIYNDASNVTFAYAAGAGDDTISGFNETSTLRIATDEYSSAKSGDDLIVTVGENSITLKDAASLSVANIVNGGLDMINTENNTLITGTAFDDFISNSGTKVTIDTADGDDLIINNVDSSLVAASLGNSIEAGNGNDTIYSHHTYNPTLLGGAGDDSIVVSRGHLTYIDGGAGNDSIIGELTNRTAGNWRMGGYATILGGAGDDYIDPGYSDHSTINGGEGNDTILNNGISSTLDGGAGNNLIRITNVAEGAGGQFVVLNGNTTVEGFTTGFGEGTDTVLIEGESPAVDFKEDGLTLYYDDDDTKSLTFAGLSTTDKLNLYYEQSLKSVAEVFIADDEWYSVTEDDLSVRDDSELWFVGATAKMNHGIDFGGISSALNITLNTDYAEDVENFRINNIHSIKGGAGLTTITGSDKADTIIAGTGATTINAGAGENFVNLEDAKSALVQLAGNTTLEGFKTGFGEGTDTVYIDGDPAGVEFKDGVLAFGNSTDSLTLSDVTTTAKVNIYHKRREVLNKGVFIAAGDWYKVEDSDLTVNAGEEVYFVGTAADPKAGVDFSDISSALNITMNTAYIDSEDYVPGTTTWINGVYSLKGGAGLTTITGSDLSDTILAGTGKTTINAGAGDDFISLQSSAALVQYNAGDGNDTISNFTGNSTLKIADGTYTSTKSGDDLIFNVGDDKITLAGAASLSAVNIDGTSETQAVIESIGADNYSVVGAGETSAQNISLSGDELIVVEDTSAKVSITASKGNDTIYSAGEKVFVSLAGGETNLIAAGGKMTVDNYNASTGAAFITDYDNILTAVDGGAIYFEKGKVSIDSAVVDFNGTNSRVVNFYDASGELQKVALVSPDESLDLSKQADNFVLVADKYSTLTGGKGNDSLFAFAGSRVNENAGKNLLYLDERGADDDGVKISLGGGKTTINNFSAGFEDTSDRFFGGVNDSIDLKFDGADLKYYINGELRGIATDISSDEPFVNITAEDANGPVKIAVAQENAVITVDDELADLYIGEKSGVDFTNYEGNLSINLGLRGNQTIGAGEVLFSGINQVSLGSGVSSLIGSASRETLAAGTGAATINGGAGNDLLIGNTSADKDGATEFVFETGGGRDTVSNFEFLTDSNLMTADKINVGAAVTNVVVKNSGDVIIQTGDDWLTLENAQGKKFQINDLVATVDKNAFEFDGTTNYFLATGNKATLTVGEDVVDEAIIWLGNQRGSQFVGDFRIIDASNSTVKAELAGNDLDNTITAGKGDASLWGSNGGDDLLIGGKAHNLFFYAAGNGNDTIQSANDGDAVILANISIDQILATNITADGTTINFKDGGTLNVASSNAVEFAFNDATYLADHSTGTWQQR